MTVHMAKHFCTGVGRWGIRDVPISSNMVVSTCLRSTVVQFGLIILLSVQIATKRDPVYDRVAGTAVVRAATALSNNITPERPEVSWDAAQISATNPQRNDNILVGYIE